MDEWLRLKQIHLDDQQAARNAAMSRYFVWAQQATKTGVPRTPMLIDTCATLDDAISIMQDIRNDHWRVAIQHLDQIVAYATKDELVITRG